jgi:hypothetical protein
MFLNDSLTLGSGQTHVITVFFQRFVPFFRALQKFHLCEAPVLVSPHEVVVNTIHNTCIHHTIPIFDTTLTAIMLNPRIESIRFVRFGILLGSYFAEQYQQDQRVPFARKSDQRVPLARKSSFAGVDETLELRLY